ncbi:zona pellucida protein C [Colossoma macropomum]|uniref:zona pellucida protein C n=1 Tax=Colossoma macropomum TaxID=42526 RepID=UPI00186441B9|nr:zona pellucida protein C [Colossoma macropomum]
MGTAAFCVSFILTALASSVHSALNDVDGRSGFYSNAVVQNVWPGFTMLTGGHGGFYDNSQSPSLNELESSFPLPLPVWDFMNTGPSFAIKVMNSSWNGLAKANVYQRGEPIYLKVTSSVPGQELYIHSCYVAPSPNPADKSRYALILNKGCVSSKQSVLKFISRQSDAVNLILDTSNLKFSKVYVHCSVVLSSFGLTSDTKSCNYIKSKSRWIDLGGQTDVCDCCATKCRGTPYYEGLFNEFKAMVSTGPLTIKEQEHEKQLSVSNSTSITAPQIAASATSARKDWIMSGASPFTGKGWIVSGASVSGSSVLKHPPLKTQPLTGDLIISLELGTPSWLPGLVDVQPNPVLEMGIGYPKQKGRAKITMLSQSSAPAESFWGKPEADFEATMQKEDPSKIFPELESRHQELASVDNGYVADAPSLTNGHFGDIPEPVLGDFHQSSEELRGDVFTNFREPQMENIPEMEINSLHEVPKSKVSEEVQDKDEVLVLTQTEMFFKKVKGDVEGKPESVKRSKLTLTQASDGSSLLSFEEQERSPTAGEEAVRKAMLELKQNMVEEKLERSKKQDTEKELVSSLLDMLRGLIKMP